MELWKNVLNSLSPKLSKPSFSTWLEKTTAEVNDDVITVIAENEFQAEWLESRYKTLIFDTVKEVVGHSMEIEIIGSKNYRKNLETSTLGEFHTSSTLEELKRLISEQQEKIQALEKRIARLEQNKDNRMSF